MPYTEKRSESFSGVDVSPVSLREDSITPQLANMGLSKKLSHETSAKHGAQQKAQQLDVRQTWGSAKSSATGAPKGLGEAPQGFWGPHCLADVSWLSFLLSPMFGGRLVAELVAENSYAFFRTQVKFFTINMRIKNSTLFSVDFI